MTEPRRPRRASRLQRREAPTVYLAMRYYESETQKMRHVKGGNFTLRNYTPRRVWEIIHTAFQEDTERQRTQIAREHGGFSTSGPPHA